MSIKKLGGVMLLVLMFGGMFMYMVIKSYLLIALQTFGIAIGIVLLSALSVKLLQS